MPFKCNFLLRSLSFQGAEATVPGIGGNEVSWVASGNGSQAGTGQPNPTHNRLCKGLWWGSSRHQPSEWSQTYEDWTGSGAVIHGVLNFTVCFFCQQNNCTCKLRQHGRLHMQVTYGLLLTRCCCEFLLLVKLFQQLTVVSKFTVPSWEKAAKCLTCLKWEWIGLLSNNIMCHTHCKDEACVKSPHALKRHFPAYCLLQSEDEEEQTRHND